MGPIGAAGSFINNAYVLNPQIDEMTERIRPRRRGTQDAVLMVESGGKETAQEVMLGAVCSAIAFPDGDRGDHPAREKAAKEPRDWWVPDDEASKADACPGREGLRTAYAIRQDGTPQTPSRPPRPR